VLKIQRSTHGKLALSLIGELRATDLHELSTAIERESSSQPITLNLKDLTLVDRDATRFLQDCEIRGFVLRNCPAYIRLWIENETRLPGRRSDPPKGG
jgi:hypothetical protein